MSETTTCPTCPARLAADKLDLDAMLADEIGAEQSADAMRERAAEIRAAGCGWWWRLEEEDEDTGQKRTREGCGREWLPMFLRSFGLDVARSANAVRADHEELTQTTERVAFAVAALADRIGAPVKSIEGTGRRALGGGDVG